MQEIILKTNKLNKRCFIDDLPIKELIPKEQIEIFVTSLAREIYLIAETSKKRKAYYSKSKIKKINFRED